MSRGLDIGKGLHKKFTTAGVYRRDVVFLCPPPPPLRGREAYILNQATAVGLIFLSRGRYSGQGLRKVPFCRYQTLLSSRVLRLRRGLLRNTGQTSTVLLIEKQLPTNPLRSLHRRAVSLTTPWPT